MVQPFAYVVCGPDLAYTATRSLRAIQSHGVSLPTCLHASYAMPVTGIAYGLYRPTHALCDVRTEIEYADVRCSVLA
eukprot:3758184-Rhodomonas_salina.1